MDLKYKKIAVLGLGVENIALVLYLKSINAVDVTLCDQKIEEELGDFLGMIKDTNYKTSFGPNYLKNLNNFDIVFRSPGLAYLTPEIQAAKASGTEVTSQTKLFFDLCPCQIIGVTGTKGKGTTSTLISEILKRNDEILKIDRKVYLAGNIGQAPIEFVDKLSENDIVVLELSSFQLQDLEKSPHIAVLLNITSDHLDVHTTNTEYIEAKKNILVHQKKDDFAVINADYLTSFEFAARTRAQVYFFSRRKSVDQGSFVSHGKIIYRENGIDTEIAEVTEVQLRGEHNLENICASVTAVKLVGADFRAISEAVKSFKGLDHRLELVAEKGSVKFYNDSFSTNPDTAIAAIKSFTEPIILIAGGSEKNADYKELGEAISQSNVKLVILIGATAARIKSEIRNSIHLTGSTISRHANSGQASENIKIIDSAKNIDEVMNIVKQEMLPGDVVLLSPASASFGWFKNYKDRGEQFKQKVMEIVL